MGGPGACSRTNLAIRGRGRPEGLGSPGMRFAVLHSEAHSAADARFVRLDGPRAHLLDGPPWLGGQETGESRTWTDADLGCPVRPSKIIGIGRNYAAHARELGHEIPSEPLLFLKA